MGVSDYRRLLRPHFEGKKVVLAVGPLAGAPAWLKSLRELGAEIPLVLADGIGTGVLPGEDEAFVHVLECGKAADLMEGIRAYDRALESLSTEALSALEAYDPRREALVVCAPVSDLERVASRPRFAPRKSAWAALEDKVVVDAFWDRIGLDRAPSRVVPPVIGAVREAHCALDRGEGTVLAGDRREGFNGGATYVRWVHDETLLAEACAFFETHCDRVRVAPFLDGVPCSIHGIVLPDGVAALRPVEMVVFRRRSAGRFVYAGASTYWDPDPSDREAMRKKARQVGEGLRREVAYRGAFTLDGVLTRDGFLPTELNTRFGAGLMVLARSAPDLLLPMIELVVRDGGLLAIEAAALETSILERADAVRGGGGWTVVGTARTDTVGFDLVWEDGAYRQKAPGEYSGGRLEIGPSHVGGFLRFMPVAGRTPVGPPLAPRVASAFAWADAHLGTGLGLLEAAPPAR